MPLVRYVRLGGLCPHGCRNYRDTPRNGQPHRDSCLLANTGRTLPGGNPAETYLGKSQRTKGASYEREVCDAFSDALGRKIQRNIGQARDGGNDIDIGPLVVECKRRKTLGTVYGWLNQAIAALPKIAGTPFVINSKIPIVVARQDQGESIVILRLTDFIELTHDELVYHTALAERRELYEPLPTSE